MLRVVFFLLLHLVSPSMLTTLRRSAFLLLLDLLLAALIVPMSYSVCTRTFGGKFSLLPPNTNFLKGYVTFNFNLSP